ncbi:Hypothetical protein NTJ_01331 [Nesidiocoris tenuis]|uniref:Uncharacterized protein n=1 Tax=Nesidiocoris tenuis TaxID=355587 RepID=A0ABN7A8A5_9HEMI|nr:Hypothetical protein NTJ_01331 [Nesidiocoris tenuis]
MAPYLAVCVTCGIIFCLLNCACAAPQSRYDWDECLTSERVTELCQKCAIKSKSNIVYPMCCEAREEAREWCERFLAYGLHDLAYKS